MRGVALGTSRRSEYQASIVDGIDHGVYQPAIRALRWWGERARGLQNGNVHRYLAYGFGAPARRVAGRTMIGGRIASVVVQVGLALGCAPLLVGLLRTIRARLEGRAGPPIVQPWRDLRKLWTKERIAPEHTSWIFLAGAARAGVERVGDRRDRAGGDDRVAARSRR